jgi:hypothetical protein
MHLPLVLYDHASFFPTNSTIQLCMPYSLLHIILTAFMLLLAGELEVRDFAATRPARFKSDTHSIHFHAMQQQQHSTRKPDSQHTDAHVSAACMGVIGWLTCAAAVAVLFSLQHGVEFVCRGSQAFSSRCEGQ